MSISITTVERIGEVAVDPVAVANSGFVYTKDVAGITQLFYEADDGTVSQLTPTSGSTPWQRTGTVVALDQTGDTEVNPFDDNTTAFGKQASRWASVATGAVGYQTFSNVGPNPTSALANSSLTFGTGGASAVDIGLSRFAANVFALTNGGAGSGSLVPNADASGTLGTSANRWASMAAASTGYRVFATVGAAQPTSRLGSATLEMGPGAAALVDVALLRSATTANTFEVSNGSGLPLAGNIHPFVAAQGKVGTTGNASAKAWLSMAVTSQFGAFTSSADLFPTAALKNASLTMGAGGAVLEDTRIRRTGAITMTVDDNTPTGRVEIVPALDGTNNAVGSFLGTQALRFSQVNSFEVNTGDIVFTDETCTVCGQPFEEGQDLVMRVIKIHEGPHGRRTRTVPAHHGCK